jgi:hypothetical protein
MRQGLKKLKFTLALFFFPVKNLLEKIGISYDLVRIGNDYYRHDFSLAPVRECAVILPHCLIHKECPAIFSKEDGILCVKCLLCKCGEIKALSEDLGFQFYITPSVGFTKRLADRKKLKAAVGATCSFEIERGLRAEKITLNGVRLNRTRVVPQLVTMAKYDCLDNDLDWECLRGIMLARKS